MSAVMNWTPMPPRMSAFPAEERDRQIYQSSRTRDGVIGPLPVGEADAWEMAIMENIARNRAARWIDELPWPT